MEIDAPEQEEQQRRLGLNRKVVALIRRLAFDLLTSWLLTSERSSNGFPNQAIVIISIIIISIFNGLTLLLYYAPRGGWWGG